MLRSVCRTTPPEQNPKKLPVNESRRQSAKGRVHICLQKPWHHAKEHEEKDQFRKRVNVIMRHALKENSGVVEEVSRLIIARPHPF